MTRNLAFLGLMGVGKTTVSKLVAEALGRPWLSTDALIAQHAGRTIADIFATDGEAAFRRLERQVVAEVARHRRVVIDLGGGAVLEDDNVAALRTGSVLVQLTAPVAVLVARVAATAATRPLLGTDPAAALHRLAAERAARYAAVADHTVDATGTPTDVAAAVLRWAAAQPDLLSDDERARLEAA